MRHAVYDDDIVVSVFLSDRVCCLVIRRIEPSFDGIQVFKMQNNNSVMRNVAGYNSTFSGGDIHPAMSENCGSTLRQVVLGIAFGICELIKGNCVDWRRSLCV